MKKTIFLVLVFMATFAGTSFATDPLISPPKTSELITSLVVNTNVTVVLVTLPNQEVRLTGDQFFLEEISIKQTDGKLVIDGNRKRNFKDRGVIYVPATHLQQIKINNAAFVRTSSTLRIPNLKIMINGDCKVHISTWGKVDFVENDLYEVEYQVFEKKEFDPPVVKSRE